MLSNIILSRLTPCVDEINVDCQCGFRRNRSTNDKIFLIPQIMEKTGSTMDSISVVYRVIETSSTILKEIIWKINWS
jgi:hypothetical protein